MSIEAHPGLIWRINQEDSDPNYHRDRFAAGFSRISATIFGIAAVIFLPTAFSQPYWQVFLLAAACAGGMMLSLFAATLSGKNRANRRAMLLAIAFPVVFILFSALIVNIALPFALILFLIMIILIMGALEGKQRDLGVTISFYLALFTLLAGIYSPLPQLRITQIEVIAPVLLTTLLMIYIVLQMLELLTTTLRIKLLTISLAIAILPLLVISIINSRFFQDALQSQTNQVLQIAAQQTASRVDTFLTDNRLSISNEASLAVFQQYLSLSPIYRADTPQEHAARLTLNSLASRQQRYLRSFGLLDLDGTAILDVNPLRIGQNESNSDYFTRPVSTGQVYNSSVIFDPRTRSGYLYFSSPVRNLRQQVVGVLRAEYDALVLQQILGQSVNLVGARSYPMLLDENYLRLADTMLPNNLYRLVMPLPSDVLGNLIEQNRVPNIPIYEMSTNDAALLTALENYLNTPFFTNEFHKDSAAGHPESGVIARLNAQPWYLIFVREQAVFSGLFQRQGQISILISTLIAALVGLIASIVAGTFSRPILRLQETAGHISAGQFDAQADIETSDEIGKLAQVFNFMTSQLKNLINTLEDRVQERTRELAQQNEALLFRTRQLQTVSDVARGIVSTQQLDTLLHQLTVLISDRFGFYHVGVFLLDEKKDYALLRAANSEGGRRMLARQHRLQVGQIGIVGYVTGKGEARIATDVGQDAVFFNNPDLPETRSEMALPLKANDAVIGALDVQSTIPNAFSQEDIELFGILADQIAIAILNNRLYSETLQALEESHRVHRMYMRDEWGKTGSDRQVLGYRATPYGLTTLEISEQSAVESALHAGKASIRAAQPDQPASLAIPIRLRGVTIGAIHIQDARIRDRMWSDEEVNSIQAVADQVGLALENARLLEKTILRAERERRVLEITGKIRSTNDPQVMINIAIQELKRTLNASEAQIIWNENNPFGEPKSNVQEREAPGNGNGRGNSAQDKEQL